jgi:hypothetical protein
MLRAMRTLLPGVLALLLAAPSVAHAQGAPDYEAAKRHYQAAEAAMASGDFAAAARDYGVAFDITKDPVLFFKLGSAFQRAGDCTAAVAYFKRYLAEGKPDESFRARTESEIAACEQPAGPPVGAEPGLGDPATPDDPDAGDPAADPAGAAPPSFLDQPTTWQKTAAWTSVGVSLALVTAGAVLGLSARSREEDVENLIDFRNAEGDPAVFTGATRERYQDLISEGQDLERLSIIAFSAAGAAAVAATIFFLLDDGAADGPAPVAVRPLLGPDSAGLGAAWSF